MIQIGQIAPDFCLPNSDEIELCLRDIKGGWLIIYFYPKDNTPGCTTEAVDFSENMPELIDLETTVIGISPDSPAKHKQFIEKNSLKPIFLSDVNREVSLLFGAYALRMAYGVESLGMIRSTFIINPKGEIAHIWRKVKVAGHVNKVIDVLKLLQKKALA